MGASFLCPLSGISPPDSSPNSQLLAFPVPLTGLPTVLQTFQAHSLISNSSSEFCLLHHKNASLFLSPQHQCLLKIHPLNDRPIKNLETLTLSLRALFFSTVLPTFYYFAHFFSLPTKIKLHENKNSGLVAHCCTPLARTMPGT